MAAEAGRRPFERLQLGQLRPRLRVRVGPEHLPGRAHERPQRLGVLPQRGRPAVVGEDRVARLEGHARVDQRGAAEPAARQHGDVGPDLEVEQARPGTRGPPWPYGPGSRARPRARSSGTPPGAVPCPAPGRRHPARPARCGRRRSPRRIQSRSQPPSSGPVSDRLDGIAFSSRAPIGSDSQSRRCGHYPTRKDTSERGRADPVGHPVGFLWVCPCGHHPGLAARMKQGQGQPCRTAGPARALRECHASRLTGK